MTKEKLLKKLKKKRIKKLNELEDKFKELFEYEIKEIIELEEEIENIKGQKTGSQMKNFIKKNSAVKEALRVFDISFDQYQKALESGYTYHTNSSTSPKMEKCRKIKKTDKLPILPKQMKPLFILKNNNYVYIFAIGKENNYTIGWDGYLEYANEIWWRKKDKLDLYKKERIKIK